MTLSMLLTIYVNLHDFEATGIHLCEVRASLVLAPGPSPRATQNRAKPRIHIFSVSRLQKKTENHVVGNMASGKHLQMDILKTTNG
jgi:hypothetical protein